LGRKYRVFSIDSKQIICYRKKCSCKNGYITCFPSIKIPYYSQFISRYSSNYQRDTRNRLLYFAIWLENYKKAGSILDASYEDIHYFFDSDINPRKISLMAKEKWRLPLNSYYTFISKIYKIQKQKMFYNPVPDSDLYTFTSKKKTAADIILKKELLTYDISKRILDRYYRHNFQMFIVVSLLLYSGARISEIMSLIDENIDLNYRFFYNEIKGAAKKKKFGVYFFPAFFTKYLETYFLEKEYFYPKDKYLFPSKVYKGKFMRPGAVRAELHKVCEFLKITVPHTPHKFRHLLNRERRKKGVDSLDRTILLNQTPKSTEAKHYNEDLQMILELREIYDKSFPFPIYIKPL
jgi:integrase